MTPYLIGADFAKDGAESVAGFFSSVGGGVIQGITVINPGNGYTSPLVIIPRRRRYGKQSARRRKLFARARVALEAAVRVRGRRVTSSGVVCSGDAHSLGVNRSGVSIGLRANIGPDHDMYWTPRGGFVIREIDLIPF